ncbi:MAG: DNA adenine methylase, partial [Cetobacterium somerae]
MKYMGSKNRIKEQLIEIIHRNMTDTYIEPFVGGCNVIDSVEAKNKFGMDSNEYLIGMWKALQKGWAPPATMSKEEYVKIKDNKDSHAIELVAIAGFCATYNAKWFGGYAGVVNTKVGTTRNYYSESIRNIMKQVNKIKDVQFYHKDYTEIQKVDGAVIYCDPPYKGTTSYKDPFNHDEFYDWCRQLSENNVVLVSEYDMPEDFVCIWSKDVVTTLD